MIRASDQTLGDTTNSITIGVSSCLLGEHVRYDGGHKHDSYISDTLNRLFRIVTVCPETECGMPVPREAMRLEGDRAAPRLMTIKSRIDITGQMLAFCRRKVMELEQEELCGFIFKKGSPSSGLYKVKISNRGLPPRYGSGLFAAAVVRHFPLIPVVEEWQLDDPAVRENFILRVRGYRRWKDFLQNKPGCCELAEFHTAHRLLLKAHGARNCREMDTLMAHAGEMNREELFRRYGELYMKALALRARPAKKT